MEEVASFLKSIGVPAGFAGTGAGAVILLDKLWSRYSDNRKSKDEANQAERAQLSTDQSDFRKSLLSQIEVLKSQLHDSQEDVESISSRLKEADSKIIEFQLTIARLAATLIASGVQIPSDATPNLGILRGPTIVTVPAG